MTSVPPEKSSHLLLHLKKVTDLLNKNAVHFDELGTINENQLFINDKTKVTIDELRTSNTSWLTNYMNK